MLKEKWLNLQLFADGGDGGSATGEGEGSQSTGENSEVPSFIPEKAKKAYQIALEKTKAVEQPSPTPQDNATESSHIPFSELIKSDEYKDEHKAYMDKTIGDRLKRYKGIEESNAKLQQTLELVGQKYGLDPTSESFSDDLTKMIENDDAYYEQYASEHDMSIEEAKKSMNLERKVQRYEAEEARRQEELVQRQAFDRLVANAEKTKAQFPEFDLETEMQNPQFVQLCHATNEDVTAAYMAIHWSSVIPNRVQMATRQAHEQVAQSVMANKARPIENGSSSQASVVVTPNFNNMSASQMKAYALQQMKQQRR